LPPTLPPAAHSLVPLTPPFCLASLERHRDVEGACLSSGQAWKAVFGASPGGKLSAAELADRNKRRHQILEAPKLERSQKRKRDSEETIHITPDSWAQSQYSQVLAEKGVVLVSGAIDESLADHLLRQSQDAAGLTQRKWLAETEGNGQWGCYQEWPDKDSQRCLTNIMERLEDCLEHKMAKKKVLLLTYGNEGENWAHQDANADFEYQAVLMLSRPGVDFDGGQFYVAKQNDDGTIQKNCVAFRNQGDIAVFHSNGSWFHGMQTVKPTSGGRALRVAAGLFQPA